MKTVLPTYLPYVFADVSGNKQLVCPMAGTVWAVALPEKYNFMLKKYRVIVLKRKLHSSFRNQVLERFQTDTTNVTVEQIQ